MSFCSARALLLASLGCLLVLSSARTAKNLWPFPWWFPPPAAEVKPHKIPKLEIKELPAPEAPDSVNWFSSANKKFHSALLVAGSKGYRNYRHQADVCHAYRILRERGLVDSRIVTFVYDDIAYSSNNPYEGQIFNQPGGKDVYPGCAKDYTGNDVNSKNVLAVLKGDADAVRGIGSGRVLKPDPEQRIFMFYSDHGSVGSIGMPSGQPLSARQLNNAFSDMLEQDFFKELVFYLESCESGSMFNGFNYDEQSKIFAVSASGPHESSYATYCTTGRGPSASVIPNASYIGSCMGDLFSVSWMEFTESNDVGTETIEDQLKYVGKRTSDGYTYYMGSHMIVYAPKDTPFMKQVIGNFLSYFDVPGGMSKHDAFAAAPSEGEEKLEEASFNQDSRMTMQQRDADLMFLVQRTMSNDYHIKQAAIHELQETLQSRREADGAIRAIVQKLMDEGLLTDVTNGGVEDYVMKLFPRGERQVVDDWDCFESFIEVWSEMCGEMDDYSMQYTRAFANLCNSGVQVPDFATAAMRACTTNKVIYTT